MARNQAFGVRSMRPNKDVKMDADAHYGNPWSTPKDRLSPETIVVQENEEAITLAMELEEGPEIEGKPTA